MTSKIEVITLSSDDDEPQASNKKLVKPKRRLKIAKRKNPIRKSKQKHRWQKARPMIKPSDKYEKWISNWKEPETRPLPTRPELPVPGPNSDDDEKSRYTWRSQVRLVELKERLTTITTKKLKCAWEKENALRFGCSLYAEAIDQQLREVLKTEKVLLDAIEKETTKGWN